MSRAAFSVLVFSIYLSVMGVILIMIPNTFLSLFRLPETTEVWIRVVGMLAFILGFYYFIAARNELASFMRATVIGRFAALVTFGALVLLVQAPPILVLFGVIDAAAATWTAMALRERGSV